jgi:ATPase subunit of ABC transporter with duplicated ATPase domains
LLGVEGIEIRIGPRLLLDETSFTLNAGDKIGLVGRNGAGKTTLMKALAGETLLEKGRLYSTGTVGYLPQDPRSVDLELPAFERVLSGRGLSELRRELAAVTQHMSSSDLVIAERATRDYGELEHRFSALGGYSAEAEAEAICVSLGLEPRLFHSPLGNLSGGQRRRVELARILFSNAETLLLDEPTNHLDADSIQWLKGYLRSYKGSLILISHDVELLREVVNRVAYLDANSSKLEMYQMRYDLYIKARAQSEARSKKERERSEGEIQRLSLQANKMRGSSAKRARKAKVLDARAEKLESSIEEIRSKDKVAKLKFPEPRHCGRTPLEGVTLSKTYGSLEVFIGVDLAIDRGSKVLVLGLNGAGKTTLLKVLAGVEVPDTGEIRLGTGAMVGYYAQEHETLDHEDTVFHFIRSKAPVDMQDKDLRSILGSFLFDSEMMNQKIGTLSGGEKTRLALAALVTTGANVLLLDEPTNNLDPISREQVLEALRRYKGSVVLVTHDPGAARALDPERVVLMPDGEEDLMSESYYDLISLS